MAVSVRNAELSDAPAVAALSGELGYPLRTPEARDRLGTLLGSEGFLVLVAESTGEGVVGWLQAQACTTIETGLRVEIQGLIVSASARRKGVGRALVSEVESWSRRIGSPVVVVRTNSARGESRSFYPALGFNENKTQVVYRKPVA